MAVTRIWAVSSNLGSIQDYITNSDKTTISLEELSELHNVGDFEGGEEVCLVSGINCSARHAIEEFRIVKEQYGKSDGIQGYHGFISFAEGEVTPQETLDIAKEFVKEVWGTDYQVLIAVHMNVNHLHCHFLINSVSFVDGHKLHDEKAWFELYHIADEICARHGKSVIETPNRSKKSELTERELACKTCLDNALAGAKSYAEFLGNLASQPCVPNFSMHSEDWSMVPSGWTVHVRLKSLGEEYSKDGILDRFPESDNLICKFVIPNIIDDTDLSGIQQELADKIRQMIGESIISDDDEPHRFFIKRKDNKEIKRMVEALSVMKERHIFSFSDLDTISQLMRERVVSLKSYLTGEPKTDYPIKKELIPLERDCSVLQSVRTYLSDSPISNDTKQITEPSVSVPNKEKGDIVL